VLNFENFKFQNLCVYDIISINLKINKNIIFQNVLFNNTIKLIMYFNEYNS